MCELKSLFVNDPTDNVGVALDDLDANAKVPLLGRAAQHGTLLDLRTPVPIHFKVSLELIEEGAPIVVHGQPIGHAVCAVPAGMVIHTASFNPCEAFLRVSHGLRKASKVLIDGCRNRNEDADYPPELELGTADRDIPADGEIRLGDIRLPDALRADLFKGMPDNYLLGTALGDIAADQDICLGVVAPSPYHFQADSELLEDLSRLHNLARQEFTDPASAKHLGSTVKFAPPGEAA